MDLTSVQLFKDVSTQSINEMIECFRPELRTFQKGETIMVFSNGVNFLHVLVSGKAHLYCIDAQGEYALLENYEPNDIFGEVFALPSNGLGYVVEADSKTEILSFRFEKICGRCEKACQHHTDITRNLFELSAQKAQMLSLRINMVSKKTVRQKLMAYFEYMQEKTGSSTFETEFSLSRLASFLCVDRTSLMRELRLMSENKMIVHSGRKIKIL